MSEKEYLIDDRVIIPDDIKQMTSEELEEAIAKLEKEIKNRKNNS